MENDLLLAKYFDSVEQMSDSAKINANDHIFAENEIYIIKQKKYSACNNIYYSVIFMCENIFNNQINYIKRDIVRSRGAGYVPQYRQTIMKNDILKIVLKKRFGTVIYIDDSCIDIIDNDSFEVINIKGYNSSIKIDDEVTFVNYESKYKII